MSISNVKVCKVCEAEKPTTEFYSQRKVCKDCYKLQIVKKEDGFRAQFTLKEDFYKFLEALELDAPATEEKMVDMWLACLAGAYSYANETLSDMVIIGPPRLEEKAEKFFKETYPNGVPTEGEEFVLKFFYTQGYKWGYRFLHKFPLQPSAANFLRNESLKCYLVAVEKYFPEDKGLGQAKEVLNNFLNEDIYAEEIL